ncbi:hypothetical protein M6B38_129005 [Iris pallida]|uniref:Uncharacterized protein n=1 Tax=Iris pallida TaxID=29817 RepID=A0AAX6G5S7_IRIPA|nr:hypothetical protein M6B38_129005 [Iris pallida]
MVLKEARQSREARQPRWWHKLQGDASVEALTGHGGSEGSASLVNSRQRLCELRRIGDGEIGLTSLVADLMNDGHGSF